MLKPPLPLTKPYEAKIWRVLVCLYLYSLLIYFSLLPSRRPIRHKAARGVEKTTPLQPFGHSWPQALMLTPLNSLDFRTTLQRIGHL